jgi:hypothetical protein
MNMGWFIVFVCEELEAEAIDNNYCWQNTGPQNLKNRFFNSLPLIWL